MKINEIDCWDGYKKKGTKAGTGKNKGKRVNKCVPEDAELELAFEKSMGQFAEGMDPAKEQEVIKLFKKFDRVARNDDL